MEKPPGHSSQLHKPNEQCTQRPPPPFAAVHSTAPTHPTNTSSLRPTPPSHSYTAYGTAFLMGYFIVNGPDNSLQAWARPRALAELEEEDALFAAYAADPDAQAATAEKLAGLNKHPDRWVRLGWSRGKGGVVKQCDGRVGGRAKGERGGGADQAPQHGQGVHVGPGKRSKRGSGGLARVLLQGVGVCRH